MNAQALKDAGIDYDYGVKRFVGRAHLYEKALTKFLKDTAFSRIRAAYEARDEQTLLATAHEFKGVCGNIGLTPLYEAADALVRLLRGGAFSDGELETAYGRLEAVYDAAHSAISASMEEAE